MSGPTTSNFERRLNGWVVPTLLSALLGVLSWMAVTLQSMSQTLAVAVYRLDTLETTVRDHHTDLTRRISALELRGPALPH